MPFPFKTTTEVFPRGRSFGSSFFCDASAGFCSFDVCVWVACGTSRLMAAIVAVSVLSEKAFAPSTKPMRRRMKSSTAATPVAIIAAVRQGWSGSYSTE
jgi:hypothetical protein